MQIVAVSPDMMGGTPVFIGTRVPVQTLIDYLEGSDSIEDFLSDFPIVTRNQVVEAIEQGLTAPAISAK